MSQIRVSWITDTSGRRTKREPDIPSGISGWHVIKDHDDGTVTVEITDPNWPPRTSKAAFWMRVTDAEAEQIDALLEAQPAKMRRLWTDAQYLDHTHPMYPQVLSALTSLLGEARANELLAESST